MLPSLHTLTAAVAAAATALLLAAPGPASAFPAAATDLPLLVRSSPTGTYAPALVSCPATGPDTNVGLLRNASNYALSNAESEYIARHRTARAADWADYLRRVGLDSAFPGGASNFTQTASNLPKAALAFSGGGYRAMLVGAGMAQAFDGRNATAVQRGTGGLLQLVDYIVGLSGGSWLTGSLAINDHQSVQSLHDTVWDLENNLVIPEDNTISFYAGLVKDVGDKAAVVGRDYTSLVDYWSNALRQHLVNSSYPNDGVATTWSDIRNTSSYVNASYPFPIVIADEREPGEILISLNSSIWEFTPVEFGNWLPSNAAFMPIDSLGTALNNGISQERDGLCYAGYDNFGYTVGTSSALFTALFQRLIQSNGSSIIKDALLVITGLVAALGNDVTQIANPLRGYGNGNNSATEKLTLVDGGLDLQNIPLWPALQPARDLDAIIAVDSSADVSNWPNGTAPNATAARGRNPFFSGVAVPNFPSPQTFVNRGLNTRPTFFACNASDALNANTAANGTSSPLVIYLPNYPWVSFGNTSTYQLAYERNESQSVIDNAFASATLNGVAADWPQCLACALLERSWARTGIPRPQNCTQCLDKYCWDGTTNDTQPALSYSPAISVPEFISSKGRVQRTPAYTGGDGSNSGMDSANAASAQSSGGSSTNTGAGVGRVALPLSSSTGAALLGTAVLGAAVASLF
ncbi:hypothetical protein OC842_002630 [Tilletia horrida]|uniref:Lysophospholipase n=1 Tax=Tilletia horrida TaxID=155126 RepID=A0AAN6JM41_9BASI|nr:hypothetical protein OC842_002630 [Tilletia horrida]